MPLRAAIAAYRAIAPVAPALRQMTQLPHLDRRGIVPVNQFARAALKYAQRSGEKLWISIGSLGRPGT